MRHLTASLLRQRHLLTGMAWRELRARHAGSAMGMGWFIAHPLLILLAYAFLFDIVFQIRMGETVAVRSFAAYLVIGLLPWLAFADALGRGSAALVEAGSLLQKSALPPEVFPARSVLSSGMGYAPFMLLLPAGYALFHAPHWTQWLVPWWFLTQLAMTLYLAMLLAVLAAALRDVVQVVAFALSIGLFLSPILYPIAMVPESFRFLLWINPMTPWVLGYHDLILAGVLPSGGTLLAAGAWLLLLGTTAERILRRSREQVADWV